MRMCNLQRGLTARRSLAGFVRQPRRAGVVLLLSTLMVGLAGCGGVSSPVAPGLGARNDTFDPKWGVSSSRRVIVSGPIPKGGGHYKLGRPYQVGGRWYVPRHEPSYDRVGVGSWYGEAFHGRKTANGEVFDMDALTAAHPTLPMPSYAYVTNLRNGRTLLVRINDRGPYVADREIDLSRASARALGYANGGLGQVRVRWAGHAPLDGDDRREQAFLRQQHWYEGADSRVARAPARPDDTRSYRASMRDEGTEEEPWRAPDLPSRGAPSARDRMSVGSWHVSERGEPDSAPAQAQPPEQMWSPMDHRQRLSSVSRR